MKRAAVLLGLFVACAGMGHALTLWLAPPLIMGRAMAAMEDRGIALHRFVLAPRITPQTQTVVRPSPDLAYSVCRYDFSADIDALELTMAPGAQYASLSLFDARTDNFATFRDEGEGASLRLLPPGSRPRDGALVSPSERGLILIRRLAPRDADYRAVRAIARGDRCGGIHG